MRETHEGPVFGQGALWVGAWWTDKPALKQAREIGGMKYPSFTIREGNVTDELGPPRVQAERVDGKGEASGSTGGYAKAVDDAGKTFHWWPTAISFPSPGCWQVTETVGRTSITYVVWI
ncbi:hypothetical protein [Janibacter alittae]|uniref:Uncharacterized protein n=1 Tax=Janibacter alittae TaxID=3115209 RepID=A0ABZ2MDR1_9MICO